jgi:hypothetical protein
MGCVDPPMAGAAKGLTVPDRVVASPVPYLLAMVGDRRWSPTPLAHAAGTRQHGRPEAFLLPTGPRPVRPAVRAGRQATTSEARPQHCRRANTIAAMSWESSDRR